MSIQTPSNGRTMMTLLVTPLDRLLLNRIGEQDGDAAMSATVRRLIRQEAGRRGIDMAPVDDTADSTERNHQPEAALS